MTRTRIAACAVVSALAMSAALAAHGAPAQRTHVIEAAIVESEDSRFVINGDTYRAAGRCEGWRDGDRVVFADGSTAATCGAVELINVDRGSTCRLECE